MEYVWLPTPSGIAIPLALIKNQHAFAIYSDHLHTPRIVTNAQQEIVWRWDYSGFGEIAAQATTIKQTTNPTNQAPKSLQVNLRYPGQYFDVESGLHYNWHRSYDQHTGRYTQADPIGLNGGWNRFGYANANALGFVDPEGLQVLLPIPILPDESGMRYAPSGASFWRTPRPTVCFDFQKFVNQIEKNRSSTAADLAALLSAGAIGTMSKTSAELRGLGVAKKSLNQYTSQLSRWSNRLGSRQLRMLGRTATGTALSTAATGALVFDGFYNWGTIGKAAFDAAETNDSCECKK